MQKTWVRSLGWDDPLEKGMATHSSILAWKIPWAMDVSWTIKEAECWRFDAFELWCWRRLLRVPWTARRSNQSILKEISPGCSLVGLMLKLKLQYFGHLMRGADSLEKTLMLGKIEGRRRRRRQTICSDCGAQKYKLSHCFHCFPIYLPWSDGTRGHDLSFVNVEL